MTCTTVKIGRADPPSERCEYQCLKVPHQFNGVSREHLEIKWSESSCTFEAHVVGRNGAIVNRRRVSSGDSALLPFRAVSAIALGKGCLVYFAPAKRTKPKDLTKETVTHKSGTDGSARARPGVRSWVSEVMSVLTDSSSFRGMLANELLEKLTTIHPELNRKYVRGLFRKAPFNTDPETGLVSVSDPDSLPIAMLAGHFPPRSSTVDQTNPAEQEVAGESSQIPHYPHQYPSSKRTRTNKSAKFAPVMRSPGL